MSSNIKPQHVLEQTDGGLLIITHYFPEAEKCVRNKRHKFSVRDESTPSCVLYLGNDGRYIIHDFGSGERWDAFEVVMRQERLDFHKAMKLIVENWKIKGEEDGYVWKAKAKYERGKLAKTDQDGKVEWETMPLKMSDLKTIFSENIWKYLSEKTDQKQEKLKKGSDELAMHNAQKVCSKYNLHSVAWYSIVSHDKKSKALTKHVFYSTDTFPIFLFDEGNFQKFYKPNEQEKSRRFFFAGQKSDNYIFGFQQAYNAREELQGAVRESADEEMDVSKSQDMRLNEVILCSGGSDALNVAALGYEVCWLNSESAKLLGYQYAKMKGICERVYYLGDIDRSGMAAAMELGEIYLDMCLIFLPDELAKKRDRNGNPCKDARDYFRRYSAKDFENLIKMSNPMKFWDEEPKRNKKGEIIKRSGRSVWEYRPNNELIYNFLKLKGFGKIESPSHKSGELMVYRTGNRVKEVQYRHVNNFLKSYLKQTNVISFLRDGSPLDLINAFHRSPNFSESSLGNLSYLDIDFQYFDKDHQYLSFQNESWKVMADKIEVMKPAATPVNVWDKHVIKHDVALDKEPAFVVTKDAAGVLDIEVKNCDCMYLKFLIQTSRVYWRQELEDKLDNIPNSRAQYLEKYKFAIDGELLSRDEIAEQKQHLLSKISSIGYLLHRYKEPSNRYCVWAGDYTILSSDESNGGTGKSLAYTALANLIEMESFNGRDPKLTEDQFIFENVTENTGLLLVDDAHKYFNFQFFLAIITGFLKVNAKGISSYKISPDRSPKMCITSNFPPLDNDKTTRRRLWFTAFADYYHKNPNGEYREERTPEGEFGKSMFSQFDEKEWNNFYNTLALCLQTWLKFGMIEPPMDTLILNQYRNSMGADFHAWADTYFSAENKRLDRRVPRYMAFETYKREYQQTATQQSFLKKLTIWCRYYGYVLNPEAVLRSTDKRCSRMMEKMEYQRGTWVATGKKESVECLYIQTDFSKDPAPNDPDETVDIGF